MWKYVLKRIGLAFVTAFVILSLTFILMKLLPPSETIGTKEQRFGWFQDQVSQGFYESYSVAQLDRGIESFKYTLDTKNYYFYPTPILKQYLNWIKNIVTEWNWGTSSYIKINTDAFLVILEKLPTSIKINVFSVIFSVPLGILLGILAALKKNKPTDHVISTLVMIFISIPSFVLITFMMLFLCYLPLQKTGVEFLPTQWPESTAPLIKKVLGYIIPVFCLSFGSICGYCRFTRAELCEVMSSEYLLLARTKGLTKKQAITRHALRNAMVPIVPSILAEVIGLLSGSMILEQLYGIPGIGKLYVVAMNAKDYNVLFVDMALFTTISLLAGIVLDLSYGFIDPRIRMGARK